MIQIRHVPDRVHRQLKAKAAKSGLTLSGFLLREVEEIVARPSLDETLAELAKLPPVELDESPAVSIRRERERRC